MSHTPKYDRLGPGFQLRQGCKPYHGRGRVRSRFFTVGVHVKQSSVLVVFFTIQTDTIAPLACCKQLRLLHQIGGSCGHLAPRHPASQIHIDPSQHTPRNIKICKVSRGQFAYLQSVPGTLCKTAKCPGETLHRMNYHAKFTRDTLQFCKVSRGHFALFRFFMDFPQCVSGSGLRRVRGVLCWDWFVIRDGSDDDSVGLL